jgi:hypothetical protein
MSTYEGEHKIFGLLGQANLTSMMFSNSIHLPANDNIYLQVFKVFPNDPLDFIGVCFDIVFFFAFDFINLFRFPPHFSQVHQGFINLIYHFKEPIFKWIFV